MPKLKCTTETVICAGHRDLEELIKEVYGRSFSLTSDQECGVGTRLEYHLKCVPSDKHDLEKLRYWENREGLPWFMTRALLQDMVNRGVINPGHYIVKVDW